jgi:hypothetical protein
LLAAAAPAGPWEEEVEVEESFLLRHMLSRAAIHMPLPWELAAQVVSVPRTVRTVRILFLERSRLSAAAAADITMVVTGLREIPEDQEPAAAADIIPLEDREG